MLATLENEYKVDLKNIEKEVVEPRLTTLLGKEVGPKTGPTLLGSEHLKNNVCEILRI